MSGGSVVFLAGAGGDPMTYLEWQDLLPGVSVRVPSKAGKRARWAETPLGSVEAMAEDVLAQSGLWADGPHVVVGFSLGALVAYEVAVRLAAQGRPLRGLVVAGSRPPDRPETEPRTAELSDAELRADVATRSPSARAAMADDEVSAMLVPGIRADFAASRAYRRDAGARHRPDLPLLVLCGDRDDSADTDLVAGWAAFVSGRTSVLALPGDHDFLDSSRDRAARAVSEFLESLSPAPAPAAAGQPEVPGPVPDGAPATDTRVVVRAIWADVLGRSDFPDDVEFFAVGGNSLLAARVVAAVKKQTGTKVRLRQFYASSTVGGLAGLVDAQGQ